MQKCKGLQFMPCFVQHFTWLISFVSYFTSKKRWLNCSIFYLYQILTSAKNWCLNKNWFLAPHASCVKYYFLLLSTSKVWVGDAPRGNPRSNCVSTLFCIKVQKYLKLCRLTKNIHHLFGFANIMETRQIHRGLPPFLVYL